MSDLGEEYIEGKVRNGERDVRDRYDQADYHLTAQSHDLDHR